MTNFDFFQSSVFRRAEDSPGFLLWRVTTRWRREIETVLKPLGLTHPQYVILATIGWLTKDGKRVSQVDIGRHACLDPNTTSQILRGLEEKKFIERGHMKDERSKLPSLTPDGAQILSQAIRAVETRDTEFFHSIDLKNTNFLDALRKLADYS